MLRAREKGLKIVHSEEYVPSYVKNAIRSLSKISDNSKSDKDRKDRKIRIA
jgi:hypothetical protein